MHAGYLFGLYPDRPRQATDKHDPTRRAPGDSSKRSASAESLRESARDAALEQLFLTIRAAVEESRGIR